MKNNIQVYSRRLEWLSMLLIPAALGSLIFKWFFLKAPGDGIFCSYYARLSYDFAMVDMPLLFRFLGLLVDGIGFGLLCLGIVLFIKLLHRFQQGEIFSLSTISLFQRMGKLLLCWALYAPIGKTLAGLVVTFNNPPGHRILSLTFGTDELTNIFIFGFFVMLTSLMQKAYQLKSDQDLTI